MAEARLTDEEIETSVGILNPQVHHSTSSENLNLDNTDRNITPVNVPVNSSTLIAFENISKCEDAIIQVTDVEKSLLDGYFSSNSNSIMNLEDSLLTLSKSSSIDGIFYCSIIKVEEHLVVRFFECGAFDKNFRIWLQFKYKMTMDHLYHIVYIIQKMLQLLQKDIKNMYSLEKVKGKVTKPLGAMFMKTKKVLTKALFHVYVKQMPSCLSVRCCCVVLWVSINSGKMNWILMVEISRDLCFALYLIQIGKKF